MTDTTRTNSNSRDTSMVSRGFTLIELMITLAVGSILMAVAIPNLSDYVDNNRIVAQTNEIIAMVNRARAEAMTRNEMVIICPSTVNADNFESATCGGNGDYTRGWLAYVQAVDEEVWASPDAESFDGSQELVDVNVGLNKGGIQVLADLHGTSFIGFAPDGSLRAFDGAGTPYPTDELIGDVVAFGICDERGADHGRLIQVLHTGRTRIIKADDGGAGFGCTPE